MSAGVNIRVRWIKFAISFFERLSMLLLSIRAVLVLITKRKARP